MQVDVVGPTLLLLGVCSAGCVWLWSLPYRSLVFLNVHSHSEPSQSACRPTEGCSSSVTGDLVTVTITRVGSNDKYSQGWDSAFGKAKKKAASKAAPAAATVKSASKKATPKKAAAKKVTTVKAVAAAAPKKAKVAKKAKRS
jgi:hypothetical protein